MQKLLNRALNFALLPFKLDIAQLLVDFNRFSEQFYGKNSGMEGIKMKNI